MFKKTEMIQYGEKLRRRKEARKCKLHIKNKSMIFAFEFYNFIFANVKMWIWFNSWQ